MLAVADAIALSCLGCFSVFVLALTRLSEECFNGLRVRRTSTSLSRTSRLSMRLSPVPALADCFRECDVVEPRRSFSPPMAPDGARGRDEDV